MVKTDLPSGSTDISAGGRPAVNHSPWLWALLILPLGYLWFHLINNLRLEWSTDPQYSYGLFVPFLVVGLLFRRWQHGGGFPPATPAENPWPSVLLVCGLAFLYLPTRLVEEASPEWRPIQWSLALQIIGLSLYAVYLGGGKTWLRQAAFPVVFFLVAVPWPTLIEQPVIQGLSRLNAALVAVVLGLVDVPVIALGNVLEVSTGLVGINDACSGIRSFQSSLMISLFLGEFFRFDWRRRVALVPISFTLALGLNLCRTSLLTWIAAKKGVDAIAEYHDEAGWTILIVCTALLWCLAWLLNHRNVQPKADSTTASVDISGQARRRLGRLGCLLITWLAVVEIGVGLWYQIRESHLKPGPDWSVSFPVNDPSFQTLPLTPEDHELLRFDNGQKGEWRDQNGILWQAFYFNWRPGRVAGYLAKRHTPDICITAAGYKMTAGPELTIMNVHGIDLPMRHYVFSSSNGPLQVYQCHWEAGLPQEFFTANESARFNLVRGVWAGRGNHGQKVLEIVLTGYDNADMAKQALVRELDQLIKVQG